jgi:acyl-CoA thioester hydrolase
MTSSRGPAAITVERKVEWVDTDAAGHHHFTAVLRWAEQAEYALYQRLGIADLVAGGCPRVHVSADFKRRAYALEIVDVDLSVVEVGRTSVRYAFVMRGDGEVVAEGVVVAVLVRDGEPAPWPDHVRRLLLESGRVPGERYAPDDGGAEGST